jgi:hypothetical protein
MGRMIDTIQSQCGRLKESDLGKTMILWDGLFHDFIGPQLESRFGPGERLVTCSRLVDDCKKFLDLNSFLLTRLATVAF